MAEESKQNNHEEYYSDRNNFEPGLDIEEEEDFVPVEFVPKRRTDGLTPRKPMSAYFYFCLDERPRVSSDLSDFPDVRVAKELAKRWQEVNPLDKMKYEKLANQDKERYDKEMIQYNCQEVSQSPNDEKDANLPSASKPQ